MFISFAEQKDEPIIRSMWKYCFYDEDNYIASYFKMVYKAENTIIAYINNTPAGSMQMIPHTTIIDGKELKSMYIGGLCVLPSYRGKNVAKKLMLFAEEHMKKTNIALSFLIPFSFDFYRKFNYECCSYLSDFSGPISALRPFVLREQTMNPSKNNLAEIYHKYANQFSMFIKRDDSYYDNEVFPLCPNTHCYILENNDGYILYTISKRVFHVLEIVYDNERALKNILGFIYAHRAEIENFTIRTSSDGYMRNLLCENTIQETRFPLVMCKPLKPVSIPNGMKNYINMLGWF